MITQIIDHFRFSGLPPRNTEEHFDIFHNMILLFLRLIFIVCSLHYVVSISELFGSLSLTLAVVLKILFNM